MRADHPPAGDAQGANFPVHQLAYQAQAPTPSSMSGTELETWLIGADLYAGGGDPRGDVLVSAVGNFRIRALNVFDTSSPYSVLDGESAELGALRGHCLTPFQARQGTSATITSTAQTTAS